FLQAEDGIRVFHVTGVQTCALPIYKASAAFDERVLVAERHEIAARAVAQKVALPAPIEAHDRQTARHRLEKYQAEALVLAGRHVYVRYAEKLELRPLVDRADEVHSIRDAEAAGRRSKLLFARPVTDEHEPYA